jgi:CRISPR-associated protein Cmr2
LGFLVVISLGPVQDFIATARRTRDLWFGSFLLSEVSKATAKSLHDQGAELIFPHATSPDDLLPNKPEGLSVANVILAELTVKTPEEAKAITAQAIAAAQNCLSNMRDVALKDAFSVPGVDSGRTASQIDDLIESYWAITAFEADEYAQARIRLYHALDARKATRNFSRGWFAQI